MQALYIMTSVFSSARLPHHSRREEGGEAHERRQAQPKAHISVMTAEVLSALSPVAGEVVVDATYGRGGHSAALQAAAPGIQLISLDADPAAGKGVIEANFADLAKVVAFRNISTVHKVLFDLGWNMTQLSAGKGFSFLHDEPLSMSYGTAPRSGFTAAEVLNEWSETTLADVLFGYGEERYARRIAHAIVERRKLKPFITTLELVEVVRDAVPAVYRRGRIHPATKTFQALRMAVNDELGVLQQGLEGAWSVLAKGGRIAVLTFHSIEDRAVKRFFAALVKKETGVLVYKKPLKPSVTEIKSNPASRSAKLRVIEKICA